VLRPNEPGHSDPNDVENAPRSVEVASESVRLPVAVATTEPRR
jgi:hypothetical protein